MGCAAQNINPRTFVAQLALPPVFVIVCLFEINHGQVIFKMLNSLNRESQISLSPSNNIYYVCLFKPIGSSCPTTTSDGKLWREASDVFPILDREGMAG